MEDISNKTADKPPKRPGRNGVIPPDPKNPFSKEYQPSSEAKKKGWAKKKTAQELAKAVLELSFKGMKDSGLKKTAAEYFGIPEKVLTVEMMLLFRQAEKAIQKADTQAFNAIMDRAFGKPKEKVELGGANGAPLSFTTHIIIENPHNSDKAE
jgi:hypothetical protein